MKKLLFGAAMLAAFSGAFLFAADDVEIYADCNPREFGRSPTRAAVKRVSFSEFAAVKTLAADDPDGIPTAVLLDAGVVRSLEKFLSGYHERRLEPAWFWIQEAAGRRIFHYYDDSAGLRFSFSAEKSGSDIAAVIDEFYRRDPKTRDLVRRLYAENYVVRIHSAENVLEPWSDKMTFEEAMFAASLIGDRDQPLWGIRDGRGLLGGLPKKIEAKTALPLFHYRPIEKNEEAYLAFIGRVHAMAGSFARNLHLEAAGAIESNPDFEFQLPEELLPRRRARPQDIVLFRYDVLVRMGFQARVVSVGNTVGPPSLMTLFREGERGDWSAMTDKDYYLDVAADWKRVPGVIAGGRVGFREIDTDGTFRERKILWKPQAP